MASFRVYGHGTKHVTLILRNLNVYEMSETSLRKQKMLFKTSEFLFCPLTTCPPIALLSPVQPGNVPEGYQRLQVANSGQMSQLPLPNHVALLEQRTRRQAGFQDPQGPTRQQLLRAGVTLPTIINLQFIFATTEGQQRA